MACCTPCFCAIPGAPPTIPCIMSGSTVKPTAGVCQRPCSTCGDGGAGNLSSILNSVGKWGTSTAGIIAGRPVAVGAKGVSVGACAMQISQIMATPNMTAIIIVVAIAIVLIMFAMKKQG